MKAKDFLGLVNQSIAPDSGLRHMTIKDLRDWSEMGLLKHGPEYYLEDRLTAIALLRYEHDLLGARDSKPHVQYIAYLVEVLCPPDRQPCGSHCKLPITLWPELLAQRKTQSLRGLAKKYGVSYESVRRALVSAKGEHPTT